MDSTMIYLSLGILSLIGVAVAFVYYKRNDKRREPDYRTIFIIGFIILPIGLIFDFPVFTILGAVYILWGLVNRDKWGRKELPNNSQAI